VFSRCAQLIEHLKEAFSNYLKTRITIQNKLQVISAFDDKPGAMQFFFILK